MNKPIFCIKCLYSFYRSDVVGFYLCKKNPKLKNSPIKQRKVYECCVNKNNNNDCKDYKGHIFNFLDN